MMNKGMAFLLGAFLSLATMLPAAHAADSAVLTPSGGAPSTEYHMRQAAQRTLTSQTQDQALFASDRDVATMVTGVYRFECEVFLDSMSATSGNAIFKPLGAGTATITTWFWHAIGYDVAAGTPAAAVITFPTSSASQASIVTAATNTRLFFNAQGTFDLTVAGTVIPAIGLVTAAAATVEPGTYCRFVRLGATGLSTIGDVQ